MDRLPSRRPAERGGGDGRQQGPDAVAEPAGLAGVVHGALEAGQDSGRLGHVHPPHPPGSMQLVLRRQPGRAEQAPGAAAGRQRQDPLRGRSGDVSLAAAAMAPGPADGRPVRGAAGRAVQAVRIHERLQERQRMMMARPPAGADAPGDGRQEPRAEVPPASPKKRPHVAGDQVQPPGPLPPAPSDPRVARAAPGAAAGKAASAGHSPLPPSAAYRTVWPILDGAPGQWCSSMSARKRGSPSRATGVTASFGRSIAAPVRYRSGAFMDNLGRPVHPVQDKPCRNGRSFTEKISPAAGGGQG